jgi:hypothetical protein
VKSHSVMFCCNDDRGNFTGRVEQVEVANDIRLVGLPRKMAVMPTMVKVSRHTYECSDFVPWVGNIFWDACSMSESEALRLVRDLITSGWTVEEYAERGPFAKLARSAS